jgi:hypothetical protein
MTKLYKVELYVIDVNRDWTSESLKAQLEHSIDFVKVESVSEVDIGEWHDDHELNKRGADYEKYFK